MLVNPASPSVLIVPGKSLAIISRTGQVWHPMGKPRGLACSFITPAERSPATAACVVATLQKSLLEIGGIRSPFQFRQRLGFRQFCLTPEIAETCRRVR